eukprot:jgi/Tetstr1/420421/TSEL_011536.t1
MSPARRATWSGGVMGGGVHMVLDVAVTGVYRNTIAVHAASQPGYAARQRERTKFSLDAKSARPVQRRHRFVPYVMEEGGRLASTQLLRRAGTSNHFLNDARGSASFAAAARKAWGAFKRLLQANSTMRTPTWWSGGAEAASGTQKELTAFLDQANNSCLQNEVGTLHVTCKERILLGQLDAVSGM